jgi:hypothetical protein
MLSSDLETETNDLRRIASFPLARTFFIECLHDFKEYERVVTFVLNESPESELIDPETRETIITKIMMSNSSEALLALAVSHTKPATMLSLVDTVQPKQFHDLAANIMKGALRNNNLEEFLSVWTPLYNSADINERTRVYSYRDLINEDNIKKGKEGI